MLVGTSSNGVNNFPECSIAEATVSGLTFWNSNWGSNVTLAFKALKALEY